MNIKFLMYKCNTLQLVAPSLKQTANFYYSDETLVQPPFLYLYFPSSLIYGPNIHPTLSNRAAIVWQLRCTCPVGIQPSCSQDKVAAAMQMRAV